MRARVVNWNVGWAPLRSSRGRAVVETIARLEPDLVCVTEGSADLLPAHGQVVVSEADYGYPTAPGRRKVLLWSREGFAAASAESPPGMPPGRFVDAVLSRCALRVLGVCIPWPAAHVSTGRRDRARWDEHEAYLHALERRVRAWAGVPRLCVIGDFNQTLPRTRAPLRVFAALERALSPLEVLTEGMATRPALIDHLASSAGLRLEAWAALPAVSDHLGWTAELVVDDGV